MVIIGALSGSILVAQSMINTAKIKKAVKQIQQYDTAISNFQERFKSLPGDSRILNNIGNNNGLIETDNSMGNWVFTGYEIGYVWSDLFMSGFTQNKGGFDNSITLGDFIDTTSDTPDAPKFPFGGEGVNYSYPAVLVSSAYTNDPSVFGVETNAYIITSFAQNTSSGMIGYGAIASKDVRAIDLKIDNGIPQSGNMVTQSCGTTEYDANPCSHIFIKILGSQGIITAARNY